MVRKNNKKYRFKFKLAIILSISGSLLLANHILPISALENPESFEKFRIAKTPDEREPEAVQQGIEQIPASQPTTSPQRNQQIDSPIPARISPNTINSVPTPQPTDSGNNSRTSKPPENANPTSNPSEGSPEPRPSRPIDSNPNPGNERSNPPRQRSRQPGKSPTIEVTPVSPAKVFSYREINFVDIAFGILGKGDFNSQGRYFHFYQFKGQENQLIQIRLIGSGDQRRSNNLSLNPFMFLLDPDNNVIVKRGSAAPNGETKDAFIFVRLPANGTYTIAVTSRNPGDTGRYSLALRNDRASYSIDESTELTDKSLTLKQNSSAYNVSKFQGKKDQLVSIRVDSLWETFSPYLVLLDSQGNRIATDNSKDGKYSALIDRAKLPKDDTYYVVVISASPQERGRYRLTIF
ncbi:PPC domain-containing protein [Calothrix sp. PCC 7507]|uniref:PPC domain-containing protein n=1 Tax=Calothrix sp. PCC 7507 TaxID=99598 RepID=UPI00029F40ED|nr:PPC domain-containing protein [Calothrix sp. PCC 7507]AFY33557.1 peptidase domain protein [Calothrix sp. PCC 7507]